MKVLLLGGAGAMGMHLSNLLYLDNNEVYVTSRSKKKSNDINYIQGNAKNIDFLDELFKNHWDIIVDFMVYNENEFKIRVDTLLNNTTQYIFISSARVYGNNDEYITENTARLLDSSKDNEYLKTDEYALSKARQENLLKESIKNNWTIIRPYITFSENRLQLGNLEKESWLYRALKGRTIVFCEDIKNHITTLTYGLDVAKAIVTLVNNPKAIGEDFHITNINSYAWDKILEIYLDVIEEETLKRPKIVFQDLQEYAKWNTGEYQIKYDRLFDRKFNNSKINEFINTKDFIDTSESLKSCLREIITNNSFKSIGWKKEALRDRVTNEITPLSEISGIKNKIKYILFRYIIK